MQFLQYTGYMVVFRKYDFFSSLNLDFRCSIVAKVSESFNKWNLL